MKIKIIIKILNERGHKNLSSLLRNSHYEINASSTYGSALFSLVSTAEIYSPIDANEKLLQLSKKDSEEILKAFKTVYPPRDNLEEVHYIIFSPDENLESIVSKIDTQKLSELNIDIINEQIEKSKDKISNGDFDGAITNARTMLESICIFIIEEDGSPIKNKGDLTKLFKQTAKILNMEANAHVENSLKQIIQGSNSIICGLASLRNSASDSHGHSIKNNYKPAKRHADLAVNISMAISEFIVQSYLKGDV